MTPFIVTSEATFDTTGYWTGASVVGAMPPPWAICGAGSGEAEARDSKREERRRVASCRSCIVVWENGKVD